MGGEQSPNLEGCRRNGLGWSGGGWGDLICFLCVFIIFQFFGDEGWDGGGWVHIIYKIYKYLCIYNIPSVTLCIPSTDVSGHRLGA